MGFYSTHRWNNGAITTVEREDDETVSLRVQDDNEKMLADLIMGDYEALCLAHSILSVLAHKEVVENG